MRKILTVAWREFRQTVLRPVFLLAVLGIPVLIVGIMAVAVLMIIEHEEPPLEGTIALVDSTGETHKAARVEFDADRIAADHQRQQQEVLEQSMEQLGSAGSMKPGDMMVPPTMPLARGTVSVAIENSTDDDPLAIEALRERVLNEELLGVAIIPADLLEPPRQNASDDGADADRPTQFELIVADGLDADHTSLIERRIGQAVVRVRAQRAGVDPDQAIELLRRPRSNTRKLLESGQEASESEDLREIRQLIPVVFMMLLWAGVFTAGQHLMMSTIEEKSNRVMEVLLSAVSPMQLMTGKILGHGAVGLLIVFIYASLGIAALISLAVAHLIEWMDLGYLAIYFFMAFFMVASMMAAVGSAVSDIREANTLITPVMLVLMIPWMLWFVISQAPNGTFSTAISFVPPMIPFAMIIRVTADEAVPFWQIPVTIVWGYICTIAMVWGAAKIFRIGVLMYGKPPSPLQLIKWIRYS